MSSGEPDAAVGVNPRPQKSTGSRFPHARHPETGHTQRDQGTSCRDGLSVKGERMTRFNPSHVLTILVIALSLSTPLREFTQAMNPAEWGWPLSGQPRVIRHFDPHTTFGPGHRGIDLRAQEGAPVLAPASGVVTFAGLVAGRHVLTVLHPGSQIRVTVEPVHALVSAGDIVVRGDVVGVVRSGATGPHCDSTCLHLGMRTAERYLNPMRILRSSAILKQLGTRVRLIESRP